MAGHFAQEDKRVMTKPEDICERLTGIPFRKVVVLDTETTGFAHGQDEVLQLSIVDAYGNELFNSLIRPTRRTEWKEAQDVHGITPEMVRSAPTLLDCADTINSIIVPGRLVVGYNTEYDMGFLRDVLQEDSWRYKQFDVMREYARVHGSKQFSDGRYRWSKLGECADHYGLRFSAHDSLADALATSYCFRSLLCDEDYLKECLSEHRNSTELRFTQTKHTKDAIADLVGDGSMTRSGQLVVGHTSHGKNKGAERYECKVAGRTVGIMNPSSSSVSIVRSHQLLEENDPLVGPLEAKVTVVGGKSPRCTAQLMESKLIDSCIRHACEHRPDPAKYQAKPGSKTIAHVKRRTPAPATAPSSQAGGNKGGCLGTAAALAGVVIVLGAAIAHVL